MENQLLQVLRNTFSEDHLVRKAANDDLDNKSATEYDALALALSQIMADQQVEVVLRKQAARELITVVNSHEDHWLQMHNDTRAAIKAYCCQALAAQDQGVLMVAQALTRVACVELPGGHWPDVMALLIANITSGVSTEALKQASLEAIGYICRDMRDPTILNVPYKQMFDAIILSLSRIESKVVGLAAAHALLHVLIAMRHQFEEKALREEVLKSVIEVALSTDDNIACLALRCLTKIITHNYGKVDQSFIDPFLQSILQEDWHRRNRAVLAFGSILEAPSLGSLEPLVTKIMPVITKLLGDLEPIVRDTAARTVRRVCEVLPQVLLNDECLPDLRYTMVTALSMESEVASNVCWAFLSLVQCAARSVADPDRDIQSGEARTYKLSPYFANIVKQLLQTTNRPDCGQSNLRDAASRAFMEMIRSAPRDCYKSITDVVLKELYGILDMEQAVLSAQERSQLAEYQSLLCWALESLLQRTDPVDAHYIADQIMPMLMVIFERAQFRPPPLNNNNNPADPEQTTARSQLKQIISLFGDFARLLGDSFDYYRYDVIQTLILACEIEVHLNDPDMIDYFNILRMSCTETFFGLILGATALEKVTCDIYLIIDFIRRIGAQQDSSDELIGECCRLVGDIATMYGKDSLKILNTYLINELLVRGSSCQTAMTQNYAAWAIQVLNELTEEGGLQDN